MTMSYEQAVGVQRRHEERLLALPGVSGVGVKLRSGVPVLVVTLDPEAALPSDLEGEHLDGLALVVDRERYRAQ